ARTDRARRGGIGRGPVKVAHDVGELRRQARAVAIGTFDGVHLGHRRVLEAAVAARLAPTVVTFDPHPRIAFGYEVELLTALRRRLELIGEAGIEETLVVEFDLDLARLEPEVFAERVLRPTATERRSRSARTRTTAARSVASRRTCSTSRVTSTAGGSFSSFGAAFARNSRSRARMSSSPRSRETSRRRAPPSRSSRRENLSF